MTSSAPAPKPHRWRDMLARVLASGSRHRHRDAARAFIADALDDEMGRGGWTGAVRVAAVCLKDLVVTVRHPAGLPITAGARVTPRTESTSRRRPLMEQVIQDIRYGVRQLIHQPGFASAAILTIAIGIGGNTAIFNVAWQAMLKPLPYPDSGRIVEVWETALRNSSHNYSMPGKFRDLQRESRSFTAVAAYTGLRGTTDLTGAGEPEQLELRAVTADYFKVFGMSPLAGRVLAADDVAGERRAVVISEGFWRRRFGARHDVLGTAILLSGRTYSVVGVMPASFETEGGRVDVWTPLELPPDEPRLAAHFLRVVGRLNSGVSPAAADAEVHAIAGRAATAFPTSDGSWTQQVEVLATARRTATLGDALLLLGLAAAAVLLIACANLASLQLARGVSRQREFGIRAALGATRRRIVTQLLTEGLVISALGAVVGVVIGMWALHLLAVVAPPEIGVAALASPDGVVIAYAAALAIGSAILFSLAPSWRTASGATRWLRQRTEGGDGRSAVIRLALVTGQIAAAIVLLISAALLVSSLARVMRVDPGFQPEGALTFDASVPASVDTYAQRRQLFDRIGDAMAALPGVASVCAINEIPLDAQGGMTYVPEGQTRMIGVAPRNVTSGCFDALGLHLLRGRPFVAHEQTRVAIVSESFARAAWPAQEAIGKRVHQGVATGDLIEVVGIVADVLQNSLEARPYPQLYEAWTEPSAFWPSRFVVRATVPPQSLFEQLRVAVRRVDPDQTVARLRTLNDVVGKSVAGRQFDLRLLGSFSLVALVLAAIGVYGLLSQLVAQRAGEIGIRLALGATPASVVRLMLKSAGLALVIGVPIGLGGALLASQLLRQFLFRMSPIDPAIYAGVAAALVGVVLVAAWLPARRAARVNPALTLR